MSSATIVEEESIKEVLNSIRQGLHAEQKRTEIERKAFEEFAARINDVGPSNKVSAVSSESDYLHEASGAVALQAKPLSGLSATDEVELVREVYEETVMSVPFYAAEYGDTYKESIREEFGPEVAVSMTQSGSFSDIAKQALLSKVEKSRTERRNLIETCERELGSIEEVGAILESVDEEIQAFRSIPIDDQGFGSLEAHWTRLTKLKEKCEQASTSRQATIHDHRTKYRLPIEAPDICAYLYKEFDTTYPILSLCSDLSRRVENGRKQLVRAMSNCS